MFYKSSLGCIEYYDEVLRISKLCDPTMLFILGLEAVTTPQKDYYKDVSVIDPETGKPMINPDTGDPITETVIDNTRLRKIIIYKNRVNDQEIYNKIVNYLTISGETLVHEDYIEFYCAGMKIFMNQLTGTADNRIVPIIFHDARQYNVALSDEDRLDFNKIYSTLYEIFSTAGQKSQTYKYIDYKSMYSYALGVLYGCVCLGYSDDITWRLDPSMWYTGQYTSLVSTAYITFNHRYYHPIKCIDHDKKLLFKYKGIQPNKIYNFDESSITVVPDGYTLALYYDLSRLISIYLLNTDASLMWNGHTSVPIVNFGYTKTPSTAIDAYIDSPNDTPDLLDLRYNSSTEYGYWSSSWSPKEWKSLESIDKNIFIANDIINLYKNESVIANVQTYSSIDSSDSNKYLFNNYSISELTNLPHGFIPISQLADSVYSSGITTYPCKIIYKDEFGNSLLDDFGNPLVWQDPNTNQYWNGVFNENKWQDMCPSKFSKYIYDSSINEMRQAGVKEDDHLISVDGHILTYDEFYNNYPNSGIISTTVKVFNDNISETDIFDCYVDTYRDKYCVPERTAWLTRSEMTEAGYRFVNGITGIFMGTNEIEVVYDTDPLDTPAHLED